MNDSKFTFYSMLAKHTSRISEYYIILNQGDLFLHLNSGIQTVTLFYFSLKNIMSEEKIKIKLCACAFIFISMFGKTG